MRELKFRAWDKNDKRMFIPTCEDGERLNSALRDITKAYPLMQYTGIKDKNGKEIYEGDIVKFPSFGGVYEVEFRGGAFEPRLGQTCEVIGNIYENPELLKEGK